MCLPTYLPYLKYLSIPKFIYIYLYLYTYLSTYLTYHIKYLSLLTSLSLPRRPVNKDGIRVGLLCMPQWLRVVWENTVNVCSIGPVRCLKLAE